MLVTLCQFQPSLAVAECYSSQTCVLPTRLIYFYADAGLSLDLEGQTCIEKGKAFSQGSR